MPGVVTNNKEGKFAKVGSTKYEGTTERQAVKPGIVGYLRYNLLRTGCILPTPDYELPTLLWRFPIQPHRHEQKHDIRQPGG